MSKILENYWRLILWVVSLFTFIGIIIYTINVVDRVEYSPSFIISPEIEGILFAIIIVIPIYDMYIHIMKKGKYRYIKYDIKEKARKVIVYYLLLIVIGTLITCFYEVTFDFTDKCDEFLYYIDEYKYLKDNNDYEIIEYQNITFLKGKKFTYFKSDTILKNGEFTDVYKTIIENNSIEDVKMVINIDWDNIWNCLIEDIYYVVQTVSTLGYGNITTPNNHIGMVVSICLVLSGQFITIIGTVLLIREDTLEDITYENNTIKKHNKKYYKKQRDYRKRHYRKPR